MKRVLSRILPPRWREHIRNFRALHVLRWPQLALVILLGAVTLFFEAFGVALILPVVEFIQHGAGKSRFWNVLASVFSLFGLQVTLGGLCVVVFALIVLRQIANYAYTVAQTRLKHSIGKALTERCFAVVLAAMPTHIRTVGQAEFVNLVNNETQAVAVLVRSYLNVLQLGMTAVIYLGVIVANAPLPSMAALALIGLAVASVGRMGKAGKIISARVIAQRTALIQFLNDRHRMWRLVKGFGMLEREQRSIDALATEFANLSIDLVRSVARVQLIVGPLIAGLALGTVYVSIGFLDATPATIALFLAVLVRMVPLAQALAAQRHTITLTEAGLDFVSGHINRARAAKEVTAGLPFKPPEQSIVFRRVTFRYPGTERPALENISIEFPAHKMTALVGESGAGKSTIADLLTRIIEPDTGVIEIDGFPIRGFDLKSLRREIAYVSQESFLFAGTLRDNIAYGNPSATNAEIEKASRSAHAHEFISALPQGYHSRFGADGIDLSGGQKQRIALARALLMKSSVIILDEPTSALDRESEQRIREAIEYVRDAGTMLIVIAHRGELLVNADSTVDLSSMAR